MNLRISSFFVAVTLLAGCGQDQIQGQGSALKTTLGVELSSAKGFVLSPKLASSGNPLVQGAEPAILQALYVIDASGKLSEVQVAEKANATVKPLAIYDTPKYVLFAYEGVSHQGKQCRLIPVRKSDGAMFCVERQPTGDINQRFGNPPVQTDASGELIFVMGDLAAGGTYHTVSRLDMAANPPTETVLIGDNDAFLAYRMVINARGDALVATADNTGGTSLKVYPLTGQVQSLFGRRAGCFSRSVVGREDDFVFAGLDAEGQTAVYRLDRQQDGTFASTLYAKSTAVDVNGCNAFVRTSDRVFAHSVMPGPTFVELINPTATPVRRTIPGAPNNSELIVRGETLYAYGNDMAGNGTVLKYRISDETVTPLLGGGEYRIGKADVSASGEVTFSGTRNSDGIPIIGNLSTGSTRVQVLTQNAPQVIQITRIN